MNKQVTAPSEPTLVLVVEDDRINRGTLSDMVQRMGHRVVTAENGIRALEAYQAHQPDLLLMDIHMPELNGIDATYRLRNELNALDVPVIFLTTGIRPEEIKSALEAGGNDYILKPYFYELIEAKIDSHLRSFALMAELKTLHEQRLMEERTAEQIFFHALKNYVEEVPYVRAFKRAADTFCGDIHLQSIRPNGDVSILLGDFTGHGITASIGALPVSEIFCSMSRKGIAEPQILHQINDKIKKLLPVNLYLAVAMLTLTREGQLSVWNCGLPAVLVLGDQRIQQRFESRHPPLGIIDLEDGFCAETSQLSPQDTVLLMSDGVMDTTNAYGEHFGEGRILEVLESGDGHQALDRLTGALAAFAGSRPPNDDVSIVSIQFAG